MPEDRADMRSGILSSVVANAFRSEKSEPFTPGQFIPQLDPPDEPDDDPDSDPELVIDLEASARALRRMLGRKD
jgi:hypothetical protein